MSTVTQSPVNIDSQAVCSEDICLVDGFGLLWHNSVDIVGFMSGQIQLPRNQRRRESHLHLELETLAWAMEICFLHSTC